MLAVDVYLSMVKTGDTRLPYCCPDMNFISKVKADNDLSNAYIFSYQRSPDKTEYFIIKFKTLGEKWLLKKSVETYFFKHILMLQDSELP